MNSRRNYNFSGTKSKKIIIFLDLGVEMAKFRSIMWL